MLSTKNIKNKFEIIFFSSDLDECALKTDSCDSNANCTNTDGGYSCNCLKGYKGDGFSCTGTYQSLVYWFNIIFGSVNDQWGKIIFPTMWLCWKIKKEYPVGG